MSEPSPQQNAPDASRPTSEVIEQVASRVEQIRDAAAARETKQRLDFRDFYGWAILGILVLEVLVSLFVLLGIAFRLWGMTLTPWVADAFFVGVFAEIVGLVNVVVKHLFPTQGS